MRKVWSKSLLAVAVIGLITLAISPANAQGNVSLQVFYDELQPHGTWIDHGRYGYVWMPNVDHDFVPYGTNGYWVQTGYGNTWVSNYSWGWAPFHYGRWFYDDFYGWLWVPDTVWGPAWVAWRSGGGYYGWAPLMPGLHVSVSFGYYDRIPHAYWNFVPYRYVMYRQVYRHCLPRPRVVNVINHTTVIVNNNYYDNDGRTNGRDRDDRSAYFTGPSRSEIEKRNGERVPVYEVHDRNSPGRTDVSRNSVSLYKPAIEQSTRSRALPGQYTRDDSQGRENISQMRTRQAMERSGMRSDDNREAIRRTDGNVPQGRSSGRNALRDSDTWNNSNRSPALRESRDDDGNERTPVMPERSNREESFNRTERDAEFNRSQRQGMEQLRRQQEENQREQNARENMQQRDAEQQRRQQAVDRLNRNESNSSWQQRSTPGRQPATNEQMQRSQPERQQPLQRRSEMPRQSTPSRQPSTQQAPARQQFSSPQRQSSQPRMSTPSRSSGVKFQGSGTQSSGARTRSGRD